MWEFWVLVIVLMVVFILCNFLIWVFFVVWFFWMVVLYCVSSLFSFFELSEWSVWSFVLLNFLVEWFGVCFFILLLFLLLIVMCFWVINNKVSDILFNSYCKKWFLFYVILLIVSFLMGMVVFCFFIWEFLLLMDCGVMRWLILLFYEFWIICF